MKTFGALFSFFLLITISAAYPMDWPIAGITSKNFGWNDAGSPVLGVVFNSENPVASADQGELLFVNAGNGGANASRLPSPLGSWLALDHGDGIIGLYSRMAPVENIPPKLLAPGSLLGQAGTSGWSTESGVYFSLFDRKERRWINPDMIAAPLRDESAPLITSVRLRQDDGALLDLRTTRTISQGRYTILVEAAQILGTENISLAPFGITCMVNGAEAGSLRFETYSARDGVLMVYRNGLVPVRQICAPYPAYELGSAGFSRGQVTVEVLARDAAGNVRSVVYRFTVE